VAVRDFYPVHQSYTSNCCRILVGRPGAKRLTGCEFTRLLAIAVDQIPGFTGVLRGEVYHKPPVRKEPRGRKKAQKAQKFSETILCFLRFFVARMLGH